MEPESSIAICRAVDSLCDLSGNSQLAFYHFYVWRGRFRDGKDPTLPTLPIALAQCRLSGSAQQNGEKRDKGANR